MSQNYVTRLRMGKCSMGTKTNYLNVDLDHGVLYGESVQPLMNANDHISGKHVIHFGNCTSDKNPENSGFKLMNIINPVGAIIDGLEKLVDGGCKCDPKTFVPWINVKEEHLVEGAPALVDSSKLPCLYGGIISIVPIEEQQKEENEG